MSETPTNNRMPEMAAPAAPASQPAPYEFRLRLPGGVAIELAGDADFVRGAYADFRGAITSLLGTHAAPVAAPARVSVHTNGNGSTPPVAKLPAPKTRKDAGTGRGNAVVLTCDERPGETFTVKTAAEAAGVTAATVYTQVATGGTAGGLHFRRVAAAGAAEPAGALVGAGAE